MNIQRKTLALNINFGYEFPSLNMRSKLLLLFRHVNYYLSNIKNLIVEYIVKQACIGPTNNLTLTDKRFEYGNTE